MGKPRFKSAKITFFVLFSGILAGSFQNCSPTQKSKLEVNAFDSVSGSQSPYKAEDVKRIITSYKIPDRSINYYGSNDAPAEAVRAKGILTIDHQLQSLSGMSIYQDASGHPAMNCASYLPVIAPLNSYQKLLEHLAGSDLVPGHTYESGGANGPPAEGTIALELNDGTRRVFNFAPPGPGVENRGTYYFENLEALLLVFSFHRCF